MNPLRVVHMGVGAIGREVCRLVLDRLSLHLVGAIDDNPDLVGRPLSEVLGLQEDCGVVISNDADAVLEANEPDVVVHTTSSRLPEVFHQIERAAMHGANVVSSTEELLFPRLNRPSEAAKLELVALDNKVAILGTGVNPGFVLDTLAVMATAVCRHVDRIEGRRIVDAATRRQPLQRKVGAGLSVAEFNSLAAQGKMGHVGLTESAALIARGMGWRWEKIEQKTEPVVADREIRTEFVHVAPGQVAGVRNTAWAIVEGSERIRLELQMYVGAPEPQDEITIHGDPNMVVRIPGGTPGDIATVAILVNAIPIIADAPPGLLTMLDIPIVRCRSWNGEIAR
jgi:4-hydroxy-tetrahydrodipicolinate reductase